MKNIFAALFLLSGISSVFAQLSTDYKIESYPEAAYIYETYVDGHHIYTAGIAADTNRIDFVLRKIDTLGNIVWSTSDYPVSLPSTSVDDDSWYDQFALEKLVDDGDGFLYVAINSDPLNFGSDGALMKVAKETGEIVFSSALDGDEYYNAFSYNNDTLALIFKDQSAIKIKYYNKNTWNASFFSTTLVNPTGTVDHDAIRKDNLDNLYLADEFSIYKFDAITNEEIWNFPLPFEVRSVKHLMLSSTDNSFYVFGTKEEDPLKGFILKYDRTTGAEIWSSPFDPTFTWPTNSYTKAIKVVEHENLIIGVFRQSSSTQLIAVNAADGSIVWTSNNNYLKDIDAMQVAGSKLLLLGHPNSLVDEKAAAVSIDLEMGISLDTFVDVAADFYLNPIGDVPRKIVGAMQLSDKIILIGNGQLNSNKTYETYAEVTIDDLSLIQQQPIGGKYQLHSDTKLMATFPNGNVIKATELGRYVNFELTNPYGQSIWEKDYGIIDDGGLNSFEATEIDDLAVIQDTVFIVKSRNRSLYGYGNETGNDGNVEDQLHFFSMSGNLLNTLYLGIRPDHYENAFDWIYDAANDNYIISFDDIYFLDETGELLHTDGIYNHMDAPFKGSKILYDVNPEEYLYIGEDHSMLIEKTPLSPNSTNTQYFPNQWFLQKTIILQFHN